MVTRPRRQASSLARRLRDAGAQVLEVPTIEIVDPADGGAALQDAAARVHDVDWVVLTSPNAVARFCDVLRDGRDLAGVKLAAIGNGTAEALSERNLVADLVPERFVAESLLEAFPLPPPTGGRVLLPRAEVAREVLPEGLRSLGWEVDVVDAYRTVAAAVPPEQLEAVRAADVITFTSASTVERFLDAYGRDAVPPIVACIGPITADTARHHGLAVDVIADVHTIDGLVDALIAHVAPATRRPSPRKGRPTRRPGGRGRRRA